MDLPLQLPLQRPGAACELLRRRAAQLRGDGAPTLHDRDRALLRLRQEPGGQAGEAQGQRVHGEFEGLAVPARQGARGRPVHAQNRRPDKGHAQAGVCQAPQPTVRGHHERAGLLIWRLRDGYFVFWTV